MSRIIDLINANNEKKDAAGESRPFFSFEYFPPKTPEGIKKLYARLDRMKELGPLFIDFTWGAGGSTSDLTLDLCTESTKKGFEVNMHLTCTNMDMSKVVDALAACKEVGIRNICALRGDPPAGQEKWVAGSSGFECALDLVKYMVKEHGEHFGIQIAGYPEGHPDVIKPVGDRELTPSEEKRVSYVEIDGKQVKHVCSDEDYWKEIAYLKEKVDAGGQVIISQLFYDPEVFLQWRDDCIAKGITVPILPGVMPILKKGGFKRMTAFCKTRVPQDIMDVVDSTPDAEIKAYGVKLGVEICRALLAKGVDGLHFYTMNLEKATAEILNGLGLLQPETPQAA